MAARRRAARSTRRLTRAQRRARNRAAWRKKLKARKPVRRKARKLTKGRIRKLKARRRLARAADMYLPAAYRHIRSHRARNPGKKSPVDRVAAQELYLYIVNDYQLYKGQVTSVCANLAKKVAKGTYKTDLAIKLWGYVADTGAKKYAKEHGGSFTKSTRMAAAAELEDYYRQGIEELAGKKINPGKRRQNCGPCRGRRNPSDDPRYATTRIIRRPKPASRRNPPISRTEAATLSRILRKHGYGK